MAFYNETPIDEEDNGMQGAGAPVQTSAQSSTITPSSGVGAGPAAPKGPKKPDRPGNFVGISTYLQANKPQAQKLGEQAAGVLGSSVQKANQGIQDVTTKFNTQAQGGLVQNNQEALGALQGGAEKLTEEQKAAIRNQANAQYTGPQDLTQVEGYADVQKQFNQAKQNLEGAGTEAGRQGLIKQINEKPRTAGVNAFDTMLLQSGGGREKIAQAAAAAKPQLGEDVLTKANQQAMTKAGEIKGQTEASAKAAQEAVNQQRLALEKSIRDRLQQNAIDTEKTISSAYQDLATPEDISQNLAEQLGLTEGQQRFGVDLQQFVRPGAGVATAGNIATKEDYLRSQALNDLFGGGQGLLNPMDIDKAGTAPGAMFDKEGAQKAITQQKERYEENLRQKDPDTGRRIKDMLPGGAYDKELTQGINNAKSFIDLMNQGKLEEAAKLYGVEGPLTGSGRNQGSPSSTMVNAYKKAQRDLAQRTQQKQINEEKVKQLQSAYNFNDVIKFLKEQG